MKTALSEESESEDILSKESDTTNVFINDPFILSLSKDMR